MGRLMFSAVACMLLFMLWCCIELYFENGRATKLVSTNVGRRQRNLSKRVASDSSVAFRSSSLSSSNRIPIAGRTDDRNITEECRTILSGDIEAIGKLRSSDNFPWRDVTNDRLLLETLKNCDDLKQRYRFPPYFTANVTEEEIDFPIAYSILVHKNINQLLMLLSAIYREHNIHCIHVDSKSSAETFKTLSLVAKCFPNVFLSSVREKVIYAHVSRLLADIACMKDLLGVSKATYNWKYLINLCSQDFPLQTNMEIVRQLKNFRGFNSIGGYASITDQIKRRTSFVYELANKTTNGITVQYIKETTKKHPPPPYNMTVVKNLAYNFYTREFLQWALIDGEVGKALLQWSMDTYSPDEHFWLMLHRYPGAPGGSSIANGYQLARRIMWSTNQPKNACHGEWRHLICILGAEDVHPLIKVRPIFVNKFDVTFDSTGPICLRKRLDERASTPNHQRSTNNPDKKPVKPPDIFFQKYEIAT